MYADGKRHELALRPTFRPAKGDSNTTTFSKGVRGHDADHQEGFSRVRAVETRKPNILLIMQNGMHSRYE
eukprot:30897-Pelagococcus_subviridis.AAC.25